VSNQNSRKIKALWTASLGTGLNILIKRQKIKSEFAISLVGESRFLFFLGYVIKLTNINHYYLNQ
jgi:hypothetical protein